MALTIKDVARQAGVAHTTVSRALRDSPLIAPATRARIRQIAHEMGYQPSAAARSLKTRRSQALGVILHSVDDPFFSEILQGIEDVAQSSGYSLLIAAAQRSKTRERAIVQAMVERRVDGVIICSTPIGSDQSRELTRFNVPIVVVNNQAAEEYRYSIYHDDVDGSRQVTRHLIALGHRRIAFLGNALAGRSVLDRLAGFQAELEQAGLPLLEGCLHQVAGGSPENGLEGVRHFLALRAPPTAIVCYNDMLALGVLHGLHQAGVPVPQQVSVTGFDNILFSAYTTPRLTTFDQPKRSLGAEAARLVLGLLADTSQEPPAQEILVLKGSLLVRDSTARPAGG